MAGEPVPPELWDRLLRFLLTQRTGDIVWHVKDGVIRSAEITEHWRADGKQGPYTALPDRGRVGRDP